MKNKILLVILGLGFLLRVTYLDKFPIGLYSDEAVFGYNAYLLIQTGHDEYNRFWPVSLESFGDWKPPMQAWLAIPFVWALGLNEYAVRLPSAILGTLTILIVYFLAEVLLRPGLAAVARPGLFRLSIVNHPSSIGLISAFLLAINPWHIFMSRMAMLVSIEVFFISLGILGLIKGLNNTVIPAKAGIYLNRFRTRFAGAPARRVKSGMTMINWWWMISAISFGGAIYSYYGSRVTVPLLLCAFILIYFNKIKEKWRQLIIPLAVGGVILSPILIQSLADPVILTGRARTTSVFFNDNVRLQLWDAHTKAGLKHVIPVVSRFFDNKPYYYARDILSRYWSHFSPVFLFFIGDSHPPFKIPRLGYLHLVDLPLFLIGFWALRKKAEKDSLAGFLIIYLLLSPFVASLTFLTPAANRSFNLVIPWTLITAFGLYKLFSFRFFNHFNHLTILTIVSFYIVSLFIFFYSYVYLIPQKLPHYWHYGRKELVGKLKPLLSQYDKIYLTNKGGPPYIFLSFYLPVKSSDFHSTVKRNPVINNLGWGHTDKILNVEIPREFDWNEVPKVPGALYIGFENEIPENEVKIIDKVYYPNGKTAYVIARL
jgi:4-amino-4-deoxy-L-arabinose transferase-like glycosyltransferase